MEQLILHMIGDYVTQSHRMANEKTRSWLWAISHSVTYGLPFLLIANWRAVAVIVVTHVFIDRLRLIRYVVFLKNWLNDVSLRWSECSGTGYDKGVPSWLAVWLMIAADNTLHIAINYLAVKWLG
jgi:hypothetical protein